MVATEAKAKAEAEAKAKAEADAKAKAEAKEKAEADAQAKAEAKAKAKAAQRAYSVVRPVPDFQCYKCKICKQTYNNQTFHIADERDCPLCGNRDCAKKI